MCTQVNADLQAARESIADVSFDVPVGKRCTTDFYSKRGVLCQSIRKFDRFFVTVFSADTPPNHWGSRAAFPTDILVLHHSPRNLNSRQSTKNWRWWGAGEHKYTDTDLGWTRYWWAPDHFRDCMSFTYIHIDVPLHVERGDVLALTCSSITFADLLQDGSVVAEERPGVFGTEKCPFLVVHSVDVYKNWSGDPSTPIDEHIKLVAKSVNVAENIGIRADQPLALPPSLGEYNIRAW